MLQQPGFTQGKRVQKVLCVLKFVERLKDNRNRENVFCSEGPSTVQLPV